MLIREIVLDTETTGLDPAAGHRLIEIGCIELMNHVATGKTFHTHINPEREVSEDATRVHGLTWEALKDKPLFGEVAQAFLEFIGSDPLIIHNALFDMKFLNAELDRTGLPTLPMDRAVDTMVMARKRFPGAPANLDALCRRFAIDNSRRDRHGALLDSELLADVYLELRGGRQPDLVLGAGVEENQRTVDRPYREPRPHAPTAQELARHHAFIAAKVKGSLWGEDA